MNAMTLEQLVGAYSGLMGTASAVLDKEGLKLASEALELDRKSYECSREELMLARAAQLLDQESVRLEKDSLDVSLETLAVDKTALGFAQRSLRLDQELRHISCRSLDFEKQSLLTSQTDLTRQREWRLVDEKTQQLKAISSLSALVAGFAMVVLVELTVPEDTNPILLIIFSIATGLVVCLMTICMISTSMMLVYILNYRQITDQPFKRVWQNVCEPDWERAFLCFKAGVPCFLTSLCCLSWMKFSTNNSWADHVAATSVTVLAVGTMLTWAFYVQTKYRTRRRDRDLEDEFEAERMQKAVGAERDILTDLDKRRKREEKAKHAAKAHEGLQPGAELEAEPEVQPEVESDLDPEETQNEVWGQEHTPTFTGEMRHIDALELDDDEDDLASQAMLTPRDDAEDLASPMLASLVNHDGTDSPSHMNSTYALGNNGS